MGSWGEEVLSYPSWIAKIGHTWVKRKWGG